jgi:DNA invertase Pin-like site-specific DNA recombinase
MKGRYVRTSSSTQSNARQIQKQHPKEKIYIDVISGAIAFKERPAAKELIEEIEAGTIDYLTCESIDRIGRSAFDIQCTIQYLNDKGVTLKVENLGIESFVKDKPSPIFKMITDVLANVAELTRNNIEKHKPKELKLPLHKANTKVV